MAYVYAAHTERVTILSTGDKFRPVSNLCTHPKKEPGALKGWSLNVHC